MGSETGPGKLQQARLKSYRPIKQVIGKSRKKRCLNVAALGKARKRLPTKAVFRVLA